MPDVYEALEISAETFLGAFFAQEETVCLRVFDDRKTGAFKGAKLESRLCKLADIMDELQRHNEKNRGIFFVINYGGHEDADITRVNAQFVECDSLTLDEQLARIDAFPLPPSIIVKTKKSLHCYWLMRDASLKNFRQVQKQLVAQFDGDPVCINESRVFRIPGFHHCKAEPVMVECLKFTPELRYTQEELAASLPPVPPPAPDEKAADDTVFDGLIGDSSRVLEKCAFLRHCRDNAASLPEPYWYAMLSNISLCSDGDAACHELSRPYPGYDAGETEDKIRHAQKQRKPHTCNYIQKTLGFNCGNCDAGCKAPVALAVITKAETVRDLLDSEISDYTDVFDTQYLEALHYAKAAMPADYSKFKMRIKGKVSVKDLERCIMACEPRAKRAEAELLLDGIDLGGAVVPRRWQVTAEGGVRCTRSGKSSECEYEVTVCPDPVVITRRLGNIDCGKERLELGFRSNGRWKTIIGGRSQIYNKAGIIRFGDEGLHVTTGTAAELVQYLSDYETANKDVIPRVSSVSRLGWIDKTQFFPYASQAEIAFEDEKAPVFCGLTERGSFSEWKTMMKKLRENSIARFISSASFAAPLLSQIGVRTFVIHLWHMSTSGKSAALKAAISVWGDPLRLMGNGFMTVVGAEQMAGTLHHLPFGIDEKQAADERHLSMDKLVYILGQGSGKVRGAKEGGNTEVPVWHNIVMITGEEPVTRSSSLDGVQTRAFELYGKPVDDVEFAKDVHITSEKNYGFAGAEFIREICAMMRGNGDILRREYQAISDVYRGKGLRNVHADYVAAVALGDMLAERIVFGTDADTARIEALRCGEEMYALNGMQMSSDVIDRAWDFVNGWLVGNENRFSMDASPCYGKIEPSPGGQYDEYRIIPQYLDEALEKAGFNVKKTMQGFRERNLIVTKRDGEGKVRTKTPGWIGGKTVHCYLFLLKSDRIPPLDEQFTKSEN